MRLLGCMASVLLAALQLLAAAPRVRAAELTPIEQFTKLPAIDSVVVSPSGKRLAVIVFGASGNQQLGVMDLDPISAPRMVGGFEDGDVSDVAWVNDDRLVFDAFPRAAEVYAGRAGTFAINHDGTELRPLIAWSRVTERVGSNIANRLLPYGWSVHSTIDDGSDDIFVSHVQRDGRDETRAVELARLNTRTGVLRSVSEGMPPGARSWLLDSRHEPRAVSAYRDGRVKIYMRGDTSGWTEMAEFDPYTDPGFTPLLVDADGSLIVRARGPRDTSALYRFDPTTRQLDREPMLAVAGFDVPTYFEPDSKTGRLLGVHLKADRWISVWFDPTLARIQKGVDAALPPDRSNRLYCGRCESTRSFVVHSRSDRQPGEYLLFDRTKASLERIGFTRPWIDEATQGRRSFHRVTTRDGMKMPLVMTDPAGAAPDKPLPAVVVVHGGPWLRGGDTGWQREAQFLASRGYRVIEPEFRGSEGFGFSHFQAGWKQWGRAMQDDLADAVQWAAKEHGVDASRVCIYGGSYGGYAALMGPITHPGVYRCAASFAGVTDIDLMYSITWSDLSEAHKRYGMPVLIGDRDKDAELLAKASPLKRVAEIKVPVLLAHGAADRRVPLEHARQFAAAARQAKVEIETMYVNGEGHGWSDPQHHAEFLARLEQFLARSLAPDRRAAGSPSSSSSNDHQ